MGYISIVSTAIFITCCLISSEATSLTRRSTPGKCVYLKNARFDEYLYSGSPDQAFDEDSDRVFTWIPKKDGPASEWGNTFGKYYEYQAMWLLNQDSTICPDCYEIKSLYYKDKLQTLYSEWFNPVTASNPPLFNPVYTYRGKRAIPPNFGRYIWVLEKVADPNQNVVRIKIFNRPSDDNKDEYLYASADHQTFDTERRNVYTGIAKISFSDTSSGGIADWIMENAECPTFVQ